MALSWLYFSPTHFLYRIWKFHNQVTLLQDICEPENLLGSRNCGLFSSLLRKSRAGISFLHINASSFTWSSETSSRKLVLEHSTSTSAPNSRVDFCGLRTFYRYLELYNSKKWVGAFSVQWNTQCCATNLEGELFFPSMLDRYKIQIYCCMNLLCFWVSNEIEL